MGGGPKLLFFPEKVDGDLSFGANLMSQHEYQKHHQDDVISLYRRRLRIIDWLYSRWSVQ
jgi:hypothetical protein